MTWNGPDPELRRGSKSCARGPNPALRHGSGGLARGPNPALRRGPSAGLAKGSIYCGQELSDDEENNLPVSARAA